MNGPNEFFVVGTLKNWNIIPELHKINVPTLIISGRHDEATPACVQPYADNIKGSRWVIFEESSHMPHVEEKATLHEDRRGLPRRQRLKPKQTGRDVMKKWFWPAPLPRFWRYHVGRHRPGPSTRRSTVAARCALSRGRQPARSIRRSTTRCNTGRFTSRSIAVSPLSRKALAKRASQVVPNIAEELPTVPPRRQDLYVQDPQGHQVLRRPRCDRQGCRRLVPAHLQGVEPDIGRLLFRHRRCRQMHRRAHDLHPRRRRGRATRRQVPSRST